MTDTLTDIRITISPTDKPAGKVADAELHFDGDGPLAGCKLIGFSIWQRHSDGSPYVLFPARQYSVNGERRSFALLRPAKEAHATDAIRDLILDCYAQYEADAQLRLIEC